MYTSVNFAGFPRTESQELIFSKSQKLIIICIFPLDCKRKGKLQQKSVITCLDTWQLKLPWINMFGDPNSTIFDHFLFLFYIFTNIFPYQQLLSN